MKQKNTFSTVYSKTVLFLGIILLFSTATIHAQTWTFAGTAGSLNAENGKAICVDASGNIYVTGSFSNTNDFDLSTGGTVNLTSAGSNDIFIASYTSSGAYRWAVQAGGIGNDNTTPSGAICTDGTNVYVTGSYNTSGAFGATTLTANGGSGTDAFVAKLNCATGAWVWAVSMGGTTGIDTGSGICLDPSGNPYVLGSFTGTMSGSCANVSNGSFSDLFVSKINPATGACVWMANGGSTGNDATTGGGICYDPTTSEILVASNFSTSAATFGSFTLPWVAGIDMCILELNAATGAWLNAVGASGTSTTLGTVNDDAVACVIDPITGDLMVAGGFNSSMTLPGGITLTNSGLFDPWVGRYSIASNTFVWAKSASGTAGVNDRANGIAVDGVGSVLVTGQYQSSTITFGALSLTNTNSVPNDDMFVVSYSASTGTERWATKNTNTGTQTTATVGRAITYAGNNNYWITGQNAPGTTFGSTVLPSNGFADFYIAKLNTPPPLTATQSQVNLACNAVCNGSATVVASGGTSPYTYAWSPSGGTGATASSLCAGTYTCSITDATSASITKTFTISQPAALSGTPSTTPVSCFGGSNGTAKIVASGGTSPYTYLWSNGATTATASGVIAGTYSVTITDANSCTKTITNIVVGAPSATLSGTPSTTAVSCFGGSNGTAKIVASGGTSPYTYLWSNGATTATTSGVIAGTYSVTITDANSCTKTITNIVVGAPSATLSGTPSTTAVSCFGGSNGTATIVASGGTSGYTYSWSPSGGTAATASGLTAGSYTCTVTDANGCTTTQSFTISQPVALVASPASQTNVSCNGGSNGSATVTPSGGVGGYTYSWSPSGGTAATASGLTAGSYTCTVTDANSCTTTQSFTISQPAALVASAASQTNVSCNTGSNGAASVSVAGGTSGYTYSWSPSGGTAATATGLSAGTYTCTVTDANSCTATKTFTITQPAALVASAASQTNVACNGGSNGAVSVSVAGGTSGYTYSWSPSGGTAATASGLTAGSYICTVTDANSCTTTQSFTITEPAVVNNAVTQASGILTADQTGATYQWYECPSTLLTGETNQSYTPTASGDYKVDVTVGSCTVTSGCVTVATLAQKGFELNSNFVIYPNPNPGIVNIKSDKAGNFEIVNELGQILKTFKIEANVINTINVENLSNGVYFLKDTKNTPSSETHKLMIEK
jgi:SprB repeat/Secretion system C-terminal sorting domain